MQATQYEKNITLLEDQITLAEKALNLALLHAAQIVGSGGLIQIQIFLIQRIGFVGGIVDSRQIFNLARALNQAADQLAGDLSSKLERENR